MINEGEQTEYRIGERSRMAGLKRSLQNALESAGRDIDTMRAEISDLESLLYIDPGNLVRDRVADARKRLNVSVGHFINIRNLFLKHGLERAS